MAGTNSNALENSVVDHVCGTTDFTFVAQLYLAVFTVNPDFETGSGGTEATGGSYARKAIDFTASSGGATSNSGAVAWTVGTDISAATYTGYAVYSASSGGTMRFGDAFGSSKTLTGAGDILNFAIGSVTYSTT